MPRGMNYARGRNNAAPRVQSMAYQTGQVFKVGAILILSAAGEVLEAGADPVAVFGISLQGAGTGMGYDLPNSSVTTVVTGRLQEVSVLVANSTDEYYGRGVNGATDPVIPLQTHIGEQYGIAKVGSDWVIDFAEITVKQVEITDIVPGEGGTGGFFVFKFLKAAQVAA